MTLAPAIYPYYRFESCCTGEIFYFKGTIAGFINPSVYRAITDNVLTRDECYTVTQLNTFDSIFWNALPDIAIESISYLSTGCTDITCKPCAEPCGECPAGYTQVGDQCVKGNEYIPFPYCPCYLLIPCDPEMVPVIANNPEFLAYVNQYVSIFFTVGGVRYCVYVTEYNGGEACQTAQKVFIDPDIPCECPSQCYYISGASGVVTVSTDQGVVELTPAETYPYVKICSNTYPLVGNTSNNYQIIPLGDCVDGLCTQQCYKLVNCQNSDLVIYTNSDSVLPYLYGTNSIVNIVGQEGCWEVQNLLDNETCDCPVDVIITTSYASCPDCIGYIAYRLVSCINNDVIYTLLNLELYVGNYVKLDCGCYLVEQINYLPPNPQTIIKLDDAIYTSCTECSNTYWKLEDCAGIANPIITHTNLAVYENKVIKIQDCDECWKVSATDEYLNSGVVVVTGNFDDCIACNTNLPCVCTILTNYGDKPKTYIYLDCDREYQEITLQPGESTDRVCAIAWYTVPQCTCFVVKLTIEPSPGNPTSDAFIATAIPGQEINGYPVYELCTGPTCGTVSFDGTYWVIYDPNGAPTYQLTNNQSTSCVIGNWEYYGGEPFPETFSVESYSCPTECNCITLEVYSNGIILTTFTLSIVGYDGDLFPIYSSEDGVAELIRNSNTGCWELFSNSVNAGVSLCGVDCPVGRFFPMGTVYYETKNCTEPIVYPSDLTPTDYFQTFGECQHGVCLPITLKNNRTIRPGYNTPGCDADRYDQITCKFADVMYKIVLEKRYGITNCCPDDDEKWLLKKELIDLQALKDPNYICPECPCPCSSGKSYSTCNCGN